MTILRTSRHHEGQEIEIFVKYDHQENVVREIKSVNLKTHGRTYPIGNFCFAIHQLGDAINAIVDDTDWREIYRDTDDEKEAENWLDQVPTGPVRRATLQPIVADVFNAYPTIRKTL